MNDEELFKNFNDAIKVYCKKNEVEFDKSSFKLFDSGNKNITISDWNLSLKQPEIEDLKKITLTDIDNQLKDDLKKNIKYEKLFPLINKICEKLNLDIDELIASS